MQENKKNIEPNEEQIKLIERYFDNELSDEELDVFYKKRISDIKFNRQVEIFRMADEELLELTHPGFLAEKEQLKNELDWLKKAKPEPVRQLTYWKVSISIAASALLLITVSYLLDNSSHRNVPKSLAIAEKYMQDINIGGTRGHLKPENIASSDTSKEINKENTNLSQQIDEAFFKKDFNQVLLLLDKYSGTKDFRLAKAVTLYQLKELEQSKQIYLDYIEQSKKELDTALWGLIAVYLKQGELDQAKKHLNIIKANEDVFPSGKMIDDVLEYLE